MNRLVTACLVLGLLLGVAPAVLATAPAGELPADLEALRDSGQNQYVVLYGQGASLRAARAAVAAAGGRIVKENSKVGVATVVTTNAEFMAAVRTNRALDGAVRNTIVGQAPDAATRRRLEERHAVEREADTAGATAAPAAVPAAEPLAALQWDMTMIGATPAKAHSLTMGDRRVLVGVMDTGIDGSHPDIAPNFSKALSRNFTTDIPLIDGDCASDPDGSCEDPNDVDERGHGTHVAGTIAAAVNGLGIAGVAPNVTLVNLRAGQDSGYFFLQPTIDALVYAGDIGVDVVNMSFYIDPWLYNCTNNAADSPEDRLEQRTIIRATQRAVDYARARRVTLVGAAGNSHTDLGNPTFDDTSPDFPPGAEYDRTVDNTCLDMPTEATGVLSISSIGPSEGKADYSNYGVEQTTVAAPGGWFRDYFGTPAHRSNQNLILSAFPKGVGIEAGIIDPITGDIDPRATTIMRDCQGDVCAYYQYSQGTSMAAPHATGVIALIISQYGTLHNSGLTMNPQDVERILTGSARDKACPEPRLFDYTIVGRPASWNAYCEGDAAFNGFFGHGIVDADAAVRYQPVRVGRL